MTTPLEKYKLTIESAEKKPRGAVLSSANILADIAQYAKQLEAENETLIAVIKCGATMGAIADNYLYNWLNNFEAIGGE